MSAAEFADWDATGTVMAIRSGALSALEVIDAAIARSESLKPKVNFLVTDDYERARDRARAPLGDGPFAGVPFLIKDLDDFTGLPTIKNRPNVPSSRSRNLSVIIPYLD
jgi:amidase